MVLTWPRDNEDKCGLGGGMAPGEELPPPRPWDSRPAVNNVVEWDPIATRMHWIQVCAQHGIVLSKDTPIDAAGRFHFEIKLHKDSDYYRKEVVDFTMYPYVTAFPKEHAGFINKSAYEDGVRAISDALKAGCGTTPKSCCKA